MELWCQWYAPNVRTTDVLLTEIAVLRSEDIVMVGGRKKMNAFLKVISQDTSVCSGASFGLMMCGRVRIQGCCQTTQSKNGNMIASSMHRWQHCLCLGYQFQVPLLGSSEFVSWHRRGCECDDLQQ